MKKQISIMTMIVVLLFLTVACQNDNNAMEGMHVGEGQISSDFTTASSEQFPHTKPIQVQHAKYEFDIQHSVQLSREEIANLLPGDVMQHLPEGAQQLTPEDIARFVPEEALRLTPEQIAERLQVGRPVREGDGPAPEPGVAQPEAPAQEQPEVAQPEQQEETPQAETPQADAGHDISAIEQQVIELTNVERRNNGLSDLQLDRSLSNVARVKSQDMQENNYFSHTSPTYGSPFDMIRDFDISYQSAAENIAQGQRSAEEVVQAWMNSEGHRANILNGSFTHIGVGYHENGHYWTQMFISK
ncbi:CAP domain-containing protein [Alkalihalobacillus sp. MEB130]|uniref:CAP domain-containing protein n=1 Tax=Alkalihalobacillus sp. MEB130 TaxID=2976704 RepID=UPI0037C05194